MAAELHRPLQFSLAVAKVHRLHNYYNHPPTPVSLPPPSGLPPLSHLSPSSLRPPSSLHRCRAMLHHCDRPTGGRGLNATRPPVMDSAGRSGSIQATTTTREGGGEQIRRWWDSGGWIYRRRASEEARARGGGERICHRPATPSLRNTNPSSLPRQPPRALPLCSMMWCEFFCARCVMWTL